jgi:flagellar assembly protein FliH
MDSVIRGMSAVIDEIVSQRDSLMRGAEEDLVKTAYDIALKLISRELRQDPSVVLDVVRAALLKARNATKITIQLAPHDFRFIQDRMDEVRKAAGSKAELEIVASPEVGRGGCRIVSDAGEVDARLEETLKGLRREIWGDSAESADELEALWPDEDNPV